MVGAQKNKQLKPKRAAKALLIEFESLLLQGHAVWLSVLTEAFKGEGLALEPLAFTKVGIGRSAAAAVDALVKAAGGTSEVAVRLRAEVLERLPGAYLAAAKGFGKDVTALVGKVKAQDGVVGLVSGLPQEQAEWLAAELGLGEGLIIRGARPQSAVFPVGADWLALVRLLGAYPATCLAVCSNAVSLRGALLARVRAMVVTDRFTAYQDFGGAASVLGALDVKAVLAELASTRWLQSHP